MNRVFGGSVQSPHPSWRTVVTALLAMGAISASYFFWRQGFINAVAYAGLRARVENEIVPYIRRLSEPDRMARLWDASAPIKVNLRSDDAVRLYASDGQPTWEVIFFSDFECPMCKATSAFLEQYAVPMFHGGLRVVFKHFPSNTECNKHLAQTIHPNACTAARIAEAARAQGGIEAFWKAHDLLFAKQTSATGLDGINPAEIAKELNLDASRLVADTSSPVIAQRINEDAAEGVRAGLVATPYVLLERRLVESPVAKEVPFWDRMAERYWASLNVPRPADTKPQATQPPASTSPAAGK